MCEAGSPFHQHRLCRTLSLRLTDMDVLSLLSIDTDGLTLVTRSTSHPPHALPPGSEMKYICPHEKSVCLKGCMILRMATFVATDKNHSVAYRAPIELFLEIGPPCVPAGSIRVVVHKRSPIFLVFTTPVFDVLPLIPASLMPIIVQIQRRVFFF